MSPSPPPPLARRSVLAGLAGLASALAGCAAPPPVIPAGAPAVTPSSTGPAGSRARRTPSPTDPPDRPHRTADSTAAEPTATTAEPRPSADPADGGGRSPADDGPRGGPAEPDDPPTAEPTRSPTRTPEPPLLTTDAVPVGGGVILASRSLVVTQPEAGSFRGFDTHCTHAGCPVDRVGEGTIHCPCHSSLFSVVDGSPVSGPARRPLEARRLAVREGGIYLA